MTTFEISILVSAICGMAMVFGSLYLLRTGAVTLKQASENQALDVVVADKVKISTSYPALGLFVFGLLFLLMSLYFSDPGTAQTYRVQGNLAPAQAPGLDRVRIRLCAGPWYVPPMSDGIIDYDLTPKYDLLELEINATGFQHSNETRAVRIEGSTIVLGSIDLGQQIVSYDRISSAPSISAFAPEDEQPMARPNFPVGKY